MGLSRRYIHYAQLMVLLFCISGESLALTFDVQLNTKSALLALQSNIDDDAVYNVKTSLLYTEKHGHKDILVKLGVNRRVTSVVIPVDLSAGVNYFYSDVIDYEVSGIALNLVASKYNIFLPGILVAVNLDYAVPETSFIEAEGCTSSNITVGYRVNEKKHIYLGYHNIEFDVEGRNNVNLDEALLVGLTLKF